VVPFVTADRSQSYDLSFQREEFDLQRRWGAAMGAKQDAAANGSSRSPRPRLGLYDYIYGYGFLVPRVPLHAFAEHIRHAHSVGFTDYYGESSRNWGLDGPMPWVIAQLLQNPGADTDRLLEEYYTQYFQTAREPMRQFFALCEKQWMQQSGPPYWLKHYRNDSQAGLFPLPVRRELRALLDKAASDAVTPVVRQRVAYVSDAFGVTERFCSFQEARAELSVALARGTCVGPAGRKLLETYLAARREFLDYTKALTAREPLAFFPISYDDWLRHDPEFMALRSVGESNHKGVNLSVFTETREVLPNPTMAGTLVAAPRAAGLAFGVDLPAPWQSRIEPTQKGRAMLQAETPSTAGKAKNPIAPRRVLRSVAAENSTVYQWLPATGGQLYIAHAQAKGLVSPSDTVLLTLGFLDRNQRPVGENRAYRVPDGDWADWISLEQGAIAPETAAWVGFSLRIQHQFGDDWIELTGFSLIEASRPVAQ
jgi:hypothetical protein